ncbi:MAG: hypothetical protein V1843_02715 [bacterium]
MNKKRMVFLILIAVSLIFIWADLSEAAYSIRNLSRQTVLVRLNSGMSLHLAPNETSVAVSNEEVTDNPMIERLMSQRIITLTTVESDNNTDTGTNPPPAAATSSIQVRGTVKNADGTSAPALIVKAFQKSLRSETLLGSSTTDSSGAYNITYAIEESPGSSREINLIVRAFDMNNKKLCESPVIYNPGVDETVNLVIPRAKPIIPIKKIKSKINPDI